MRKGIVLSAAETLFPGYFALVMATAAVSIASFLLGYAMIAHSLVWLNWLFYLCLWGLTGIRIVRFPERIGEDLFDHQRAPGFFTLVAGTCVLGTLRCWSSAAAPCCLGPVADLASGCGLLVYVVSFFTCRHGGRENKPPLDAGINGAWLVAVVATQSTCSPGPHCYFFRDPSGVGPGLWWPLLMPWLCCFLLGLPALPSQS